MKQDIVDRLNQALATALLATHGYTLDRHAESKMLAECLVDVVADEIVTLHASVDQLRFDAGL